LIPLSKLKPQIELHVATSWINARINFFFDNFFNLLSRQSTSCCDRNLDLRRKLFRTAVLDIDLILRFFWWFLFPFLWFDNSTNIPRTAVLLRPLPSRLGREPPGLCVEIEDSRLWRLGHG